MMAMEQWPNELPEGLNLYFRQQRPPLGMHRHNSAPCREAQRHPNLSQNRHQRKSLIGAQLGNHDLAVVASERLRCPPSTATNSNSDPRLESRLAGMSMNEWWVDDQVHLSRQVLLDSIALEQHYRGREERRLSSREKLGDSITGEHYNVRGEERMIIPGARVGDATTRDHNYVGGGERKTIAGEKMGRSITGEHKHVGGEERKSTSEKMGVVIGGEHCYPRMEEKNMIPGEKLGAPNTGEPQYMRGEERKSLPRGRMGDFTSGEHNHVGGDERNITGEKVGVSTAGEHYYMRVEEKKMIPGEQMGASNTREQKYVTGEERKNIPRETKGDLAPGEHEHLGGGEKDNTAEKMAGVSTSGEHSCMGGEERKNIPGETVGLSTTGEHNHMGGEERRKGSLPIVRPASLEVGNGTMSEWWSSLSDCVGTKRSSLHNEIVAFCLANELTPEQVRARRLAQDFLESEVLEIWPNADVHLYGSTATGLALPTSDIDIVVVMQPAAAQQKGFPRVCNKPLTDTGPWVTELYTKLQRLPDVFQSLTQIPHAKVPILKAVFKSGLACDISFDWHDNRPGQGVQIVKHFLRQHKALKALCVVLKSFLRHHKLNEVFTGGIGSFCLTVMVVSLLQNLPREGAAAGYDLGALLVSFFMYYSNMHNYATDVVCATSTGKCTTLHKHARGWVNWGDPERIAVENPLDPTSDIGSASYNIHDVRAKFSQANRVLLRHWDEENLLNRIFKPCIT